MEVALALPVVVLALLLVIQVALVARAQVVVTNAAREGARAAAVDPDSGAALAAVRAASDLDPSRLTVHVSPRGEIGSNVTVTVSYRVPTEVALVGPLVGEPTLEAAVTMRVEGEVSRG